MNSEAKHRTGSEGTLNGLIIVSSALVAAITTMAMVTWGGGKREGVGGGQRPGRDEDAPSAATSARERASSGKSQGVRVSPPRLAL